LITEACQRYVTQQIEIAVSDADETGDL